MEMKGGLTCGFSRIGTDFVSGTLSFIKNNGVFGTHAFLWMKEKEGII